MSASSPLVFPLSSFPLVPPLALVLLYATLPLLSPWTLHAPLPSLPLALAPLAVGS